MPRRVYIIVNHETGQAYAGLTNQIGRRITEHRRNRPHLFTGRHTVFKSEPMTDEAAQRKEARAVRFLQSIGFHTVNVKQAGSLRSWSKPFWTKERCADEALKYATRGMFVASAGSAYNTALRHGWLDEICAHMMVQRKPKGYWTKSRCADEAAKYTTRAEFQRNAKGVYNTARRNGWFDEICCHMPYIKRPNEPLRRPT